MAHRRGMRKIDAGTDEKQWGSTIDDVEPLMGVPSVATAPVPLPDIAPNEPEPGIETEQEDGRGRAEFEPPTFGKPES